MNARRRKSGQAMLEYILVFIALLGLVAAVKVFAETTRKKAAETAEIVTSDTP